MSLQPLTVFSNNQLFPVYDEENAKTLPVNLLAGNYERGTVLGQVTSTGANDVQTVTIGGSPTGGTWTYTATPTSPNSGQPAVTLTEAYNVSLAQLQSDLESIYGPGNVVVTGTAGTTYTITSTGADALLPITIAVVDGTGLTGGTSPTATIAHTTLGVGATGTYGPYVSGHSDGTQLPKAILMYPCTVTNVAGVLQIVPGNQGSGPEIPGYFELCAQAYFRGTFRTEELVGLDANAVTKLGGNIVAGTASAGVFSF